jgi:uncharacterized protein (DUF2267 family)
VVHITPRRARITSRYDTGGALPRDDEVGEVTVNDERFISIVQREAGVDTPAAEQAARATLQTLSERLMDGVRRRLAGVLPEQAARWITSARDRETFGADEFLRRTAVRAGTGTDGAELLATAVFYALGRALTAPDFETMAAELPEEYDPLLAPARRPPVDILPVEDFLRRVADRAGVDVATARAASEAVLETLGERLAGGEVDDLRKELPPELREPMVRGNDHTGGQAHRMSLAEFLTLAAMREGVPLAEALEHDRAVFSTLRDAFTEKAFSDMSAELPKDYLELARP